MACVAAIGCCLNARSGYAETLADAIALAYDTNPSLQGQRAQLRATDEAYVQARAGWRPTVQAQISTNYYQSPQTGIFGGVNVTETNNGSAALTISQPLYTGGRVASQVRAADAQILAGRENLRAVEASVILAVIQAYCDVMRDRRSVEILRASLADMQNASDEIKARFDAGANSRADVAQADAQVEATKALLVSAEGQLSISQAAYVAAVGQSPGELAPLPRLPGVPKTIDLAFEAVDVENPTLQQARYAEQQARDQIAEARAGERATLSVNASAGYTSEVVPLNRRDVYRDITASAVLTQPLMAGGAIRSQIRQAQQQDEAAELQVEAVRRSVIQAVAQSWGQWSAAHATSIATEAEVKAAALAVDGNREEYRAGLRTTLDVLIAEETLRDSQTALIASVHDDYVYQAAVLSAVGRLDAGKLLLGVPLYNPKRNLNQVKLDGMVPWEYAVEALDMLGAPNPGKAPHISSIPQPRAPAQVAPPNQ